MKRLQKTEFINKLLASTVGADVDTTNFPVWEVVATSSVPLRGKDGTIFEGAVIKPNTLFELAALINREPLPLMVDHDMSGHPKGKFFHSQVIPNDFGHQELRGFKYVDPTESDTIAKIDNGTVDEVSIAFAAREMRCSKCGWDFVKAVENDDFMALMTRTCENGHQIGKDGTHLELDGVKDALELSLVSRGAAKNSKIIGQSDSKLSKQVERLAAHGLSLSDLYVTASASKGFDEMDMNELIVQLSDAKAKVAVGEKEVERLDRELAEERGKRNEADTRVAELERELQEARAAAQSAPAEETDEVKQKREQESRDAKASVEFLQKQFKAVMAAAGKTDAVAPESAEELIAAIEETHPKLSAIIPIDGVTLGADAGKGSEQGEQDFASFRPFSRQNKR